MADEIREKRRGRPFEKGNKAAVGGKGGGRPPDWLKTQCQGLVESNNIISFLVDVASGKAIREISVGDSAVKISAPADIKDRLRAAEMLMDRGWGKPSQSMELSGSVGTDINEAVERG